eukprot:GHVO01005632.1.p1 GENE.GHVO01005632.1~~GHVO01005632.1.p1  ORF type:complete len:140 (+),score=14.43 GHVO01005632.1:36-455(+)
MRSLKGVVGVVPAGLLGASAVLPRHVGAEEMRYEGAVEAGPASVNEWACIDLQTNNTHPVIRMRAKNNGSCWDTDGLMKFRDPENRRQSMNRLKVWLKGKGAKIWLRVVARTKDVPGQDGPNPRDRDRFVVLRAKLNYV